MRIQLIQDIIDICRKKGTEKERALLKKIALFEASKSSYCPICKKNAIFKPFGIIPRKNAQCPHCGSLERHRAFFPIYEEAFLKSTKKNKILHTAPEKCLADIFIKNDFIEYYPIDLFPEKYKHVSCCKADVTDICFKNNFFDFVISHQVLEHIIEEEQCLNEMLRVLKTNGILFLNIPIFKNLEKTFEDSSIITPEDRLKHYGQEDHVRKYGIDIIEKLKNKYNAKVHDINNQILFEIIKTDK